MRLHQATALPGRFSRNQAGSKGTILDTSQNLQRVLAVSVANPAMLDVASLRKGSTLVLPLAAAERPRVCSARCMAHPQRHKGINYVGRETFLITATTRNQVRAFEDLDFGRKAIEQLFACATAERIAIPVCVYMLDHAHVVTVGTTTTSDVREFVYEWKKATGFAWSQRGNGRLWQPGFWDNHLRASSSITEFIKYCVLNPVRAGLVTDPADYPLIASDRYTIEELVALATSAQFDDGAPADLADHGSTPADQGSTKVLPFRRLLPK